MSKNVAQSLLRVVTGVVLVKESPMIKLVYGSFKRVLEIRVMAYLLLCVPCIGFVESLYMVP